jgi:protein-disulfide isomerase
MKLCRKSVLWGALGGLVSTVLLGGSWFFLGRQKSAEIQLTVDSLAVKSDLPLFTFRGQSIFAHQLPSPLKSQFEKAVNLRTQIQRDADIQLYKEVDKLARLYVLEKTIAAQTAATQKSQSEIEEELLAREEADADDARMLYEASDPSAPREGFLSVREQLVSYLNEVRRRESLETWSNSLREKGEWSVALRRPEGTLKIPELNLDGLPRDARGTPNAVVFVDYLCEGCVPFFVDFAQRVEAHRGALGPVYVPFPYTNPEVSIAFARGALCAHQLGEFASFHMAALTKGELLSEVSVFDLARDTDMKMSEFRACWRSGEGLAELLGKAQKLARQTGLMQTPAVVFGGQLFEGSNMLDALDKAVISEGQAEKLTKREQDNKPR